VGALLLYDDINQNTQNQQDNYGYFADLRGRYLIAHRPNYRPEEHEGEANYEPAEHNRPLPGDETPDRVNLPGAGRPPNSLRCYRVLLKS
jgi:hypothetical protein